MPRTRLIYLTSEPLSETIVDYYLHLLPGVPAAHARARLTLLSCFDGSNRPLTEKILERPRLMARLAEALGDPARADIAAYTVSGLERTLAVRLGAPLYGCDPDLQVLGTKSGGRRLMREAGVDIPDGIEDLADAAAVAEGLAALKARNPGLRRAVVKLNGGFSGEGNATFRFDGAPQGPSLAPWIRDRLPDLAFEARGMTWETFSGKISQMGAIVEAFIEGAEKRSPSAQFLVEPWANWSSSRPTTSCWAVPEARSIWAVTSRPTKAIARRSRPKAKRSAAPWRGTACSAASGWISFRRARTASGVARPSRSTCARVAPPTRS